MIYPRVPKIRLILRKVNFEVFKLYPTSVNLIILSDIFLVFRLRILGSLGIFIINKSSVSFND